MRKPLDPPRPEERQVRVQFRRMRHDDLARVMEIERAAFAHPWSADLLRRELTHDWSTILLATDRVGPAGGEAERILGFVIYWLVHDEVHVLNVAVADEARRRGVGRTLMLEAHARGRRLGGTVATLEVRTTNTPAIELYRSLGYREIGVRPNYYADEGEDALVMVIDL